MFDTIPEEWKTETLLLLVGGNPLPNYVAAKLLLKPGGTLHLLYSHATGDIASAIAAAVGAQHLAHEISNPASRSSVSDRVAEVLDKHCRNRTVGLHYTGGTKSMAVHAHAAVRQHRQDAVLTYLDSRTLHLYCDGSIGAVPVQYSVEPTLVDLLKLHGLQLVHEDHFLKDGQPRWPDLILGGLNAALARAHSQSEGAKAYAEWCQTYLRDAKRNSLVRKAQHFPVSPLPFPEDPCLHEVTEQMKVAYGLVADSFDPQTVVQRNNSEVKSIGDLVAHLDGKWLEYCVADAFIQNRTEHRLNSVGMSLDIDGKQSVYDFEVDVGALQGYQLYAVSCTRSAEKRLCKSKLFEALIRAEQLGGSEAKTALVCAFDKPGELEKEVRERWRPETSSRIRVFGAEHLPDLKMHLGVWLKQP